MKSPRTGLSPLEEAGCRLVLLVGTRSGHLLLSDNQTTNLQMAKKIRAFDWQSYFKEDMLKLADRIEAIANRRLRESSK